MIRLKWTNLLDGRKGCVFEDVQSCEGVVCRVAAWDGSSARKGREAKEIRRAGKNAHCQKGLRF